MWWIQSWVHRNQENPSPASSISYQTISPVTPLCLTTERPVSYTFSCVSQWSFNMWPRFPLQCFRTHSSLTSLTKRPLFFFLRKGSTLIQTRNIGKHCSLVALLIREMYFWIESILLKWKALRHTTKRTHTHTIPGSNWDILKTLTLTWTTTKMWIIG
jgi:hypothetical protein